MPRSHRNDNAAGLPDMRLQACGHRWHCFSDLQQMCLGCYRDGMAADTEAYADDCPRCGDYSAAGTGSRLCRRCLDEKDMEQEEVEERLGTQAMYLWQEGRGEL